MNTPLPPQRRSIAGAALACAAVDGTLRLQRCGDCGAVQYPPRERCGECLGDTLPVEPVANGATVLAVTALQHSLEPWFAARLPWTVASLRLDAGPVAFAHGEASLAEPGARVRVASVPGPGGAWCLVAFGAGNEDAGAALDRTLNNLGLST